MQSRSAQAPVQKVQFELGASAVGASNCAFQVWAPFAETVEVHLLAPEDRIIPLEPAGRGYFQGIGEDVTTGALYKYRLPGGREFPDPASRSQPQGVHGPSEVVEPSFPWTDAAWRGLPLEQYIIYELHVGAFATCGTFDGVIQKLDYLAELGITALQIMPVAQFPGDRNWGYDGVYPFAVQHSYGGARGFKRLVDAAHGRGLAVILDVVYNHLGPEGNYLSNFGPYFTKRYQTPWGEAVNFDGEHSEAVRRYFLDNAAQWISDFHVDALRLDAVHAIFDQSERHIVREIGEVVHRHADVQERLCHVIAECDQNEAKLVRSVAEGGHGLDAQWSDDFHHSLHGLLTGERSGYYCDFGGLEHLAKALSQPYVYCGEYSEYRKRPHGTSAAGLPPSRFVVFSENHDQVGNRALGERLEHLTSLEDLKLATSIVLLSPYVPLLFMGQEYAEQAPFLYFASHSDPHLVEAVRQGRKQEFDFAGVVEASDPFAENTFLRSRLDHALREQTRHRAVLEFTRELIRLRKQVPALRHLTFEHARVQPVADRQALTMRRRHEGCDVLAVFHFAKTGNRVIMEAPRGRWKRVLASTDERFLGPGTFSPAELFSDGRLTMHIAPRSCCVYVQG
ncbi:MAG: malto-oligosyltrehalose trehalohydrolase [Acidobacteria bacterium]|nr:malto-oligosyltrehalose trehalohydrolase [Acidobacteriota bacterium]